MSKFKDSEGREWTIKIDVNAVGRVLDDCKVDLLAIGNGDASGATAIVTNPMILIPTLYAICKPQTEKLGITAADFTGAITGDVIDAGIMALIEGITDFFPAGRRRVLKQALALVMQADAMAVQNAAMAINNLDVKSLLMKSAGSSGSLQGTSELTPDPARSGN